MSEINYHIEISSLIEFINDQIRSNALIPLSGAEIFEHIKRVVLDSETKPFLYNPPKEDEIDYYNNYCKRVKEINENYIPDFFENEGDFYDFGRMLNVYKESTNWRTFTILFSLKMQEVKHKNLPIPHFLSFQLYDNFYGDKDSFANFLRELLSIDGNSHLLSSNFNDEIAKWIEKGYLLIEGAYVDIEMSKDTVSEDEMMEFKNLLESKRGFKIPGKLTDEQIRKFFSFLYLENSADKKPFLVEEDVNAIFKKGLTIPKNIPDRKFYLNTSLKYPKKIVEKGIHLFFTKHSLTTRDKIDFILFFAHYIKDFEKALESPQNLKNAAGNLNGKSSPKNMVKWDDYLPQ